MHVRSVARDLDSGQEGELLARDRWVDQHRSGGMLASRRAAEMVVAAHALSVSDGTRDKELHPSLTAMGSVYGKFSGVFGGFVAADSWCR